MNFLAAIKQGLKDQAPSDSGIKNQPNLDEGICSKCSKYCVLQDHMCEIADNQPCAYDEDQLQNSKCYLCGVIRSGENSNCDCAEIDDEGKILPNPRLVKKEYQSETCETCETCGSICNPDNPYCVCDTLDHDERDGVVYDRYGSAGYKSYEHYLKWNNYSEYLRLQEQNQNADSSRS